MSNGKSPGNRSYTIANKNTDEWIVESLIGQTGPYGNAGLALQFAAREALAARERGENAEIFVQDEYGTSHLCTLMNENDGMRRCGSCQASWLKPLRSLPPKCPVWSAIDDWIARA
jgi:hypothetical protein